MILLISIILTGTFCFLSGVHLYWICGGKWGADVSIPTRDDNSTKLFVPSIKATFAVAIILLGFSLITLLNGIQPKIELHFLSAFVYDYALNIIAFIFILRAIGDFNYVGFFKKYKHTSFGKNDTKYYSPLCLTIGILAIILQYGK